MTKRRRDRFERSKIVIPILLAGWIPSVLTLIVSYTILRDTLESRILRDRQTLIQLVSHVVGHDLSQHHKCCRVLSNAAGDGQSFDRCRSARGSAMGQFNVLLTSADRWNVCQRSGRHSDCLDSNGPRVGGQRLWIPALA